MNKRTMIIAYIVLLHLCLGALIARPLIRRVRREGGGRTAAEARVYRYDDVLRVHERIDATTPDGAIVCFGDSILQGVCPLAIGNTTVNFGIGRDTVEDVRRRLGRYGSLQRCGGIVLAAGINDLTDGTAEEVAESYRLLLQELPEKVPILVCGVLPVDPDARAKPANAEIAALNRRLAELCERDDRVFYLPPPEALMDQTGALPPQVHEGDGIHLNRQGYAVWTAAIREALSVLSSR